MKKNILMLSGLLAFAIIGTVVANEIRKAEAVYIKNAGKVFGTTYHITYESPRGIDFQREIEKQLDDFENSMSVYRPNSIISRVNKNDTAVVIDHYFRTVFDSAKVISKTTNGAFDMTVAPLVNAWGFGFEKSKEVNKRMIDSLKTFVGYEKIDLIDREIYKQDPRTMLDASAIAKGYGADVIAWLLETKKVANYMVEIGGEVVVKGKNSKGMEWHIGINRPVDDLTQNNQDIVRVVKLGKGAMATSGNYRQFYYKDGKKYAHTIDPRTGYPTEHSLLSATIIAPTCLLADAYATACMVLGVQESLSVITALPNVEAYLIAADSDGQMREYMTSGFQQYLAEPKKQ